MVFFLPGQFSQLPGVLGFAVPDSRISWRNEERKKLMKFPALNLSVHHFKKSKLVAGYIPIPAYMVFFH